MKNTINLKKTIYIILTMVLMVFLMSIVHSLAEYIYLSGFTSAELQPRLFRLWIFSTFLHPAVPLLLLIFALISGYFLGQTWWRIIYIEKRREKWLKERKKKK